jgi:hypothetical protein
MNKRNFLLDAVIIALLLVAGLGLAAPYAAMEFSSQAWNNDYIYIALARMFREQPATWNGLQYCGTPVNHIYPPLFQFLMAIMPLTVGHAYHLLSALGYALVPVSLYILAVQLLRSRFAAAFAAITYGLLASPVYVLPMWRTLASQFHYAPWGFIALMSYSEAGHPFALAIAMASLASAWRNWWKLAAVLAGLVFLSNWPGIIGLLLGLTAIGVAKTRELGWFPTAKNCFATAGIGYGLAAFWMTPGAFATTTLLDRIVLRTEELAAPWNQTTSLVVLAGCVILGLALFRRTPAALSYLLASVSLFGVVVVAFSLAGNYLAPLPHRYVMELNVTLVLLIAWLTTLSRRWAGALTLTTVLAGGWAAWGFLADPWKLQPARGVTEPMMAFQMADWLQRNAGSDRVFTSGELDGALNALSTVSQVGGTRQGISNPLILAAQRQIGYNCMERPRAARLNELWLRALDARFVAVHDASSQEYFHWFVQPEAFSAFPAVWTNHSGDTIYRVPPPEQHSAVVVKLSQLRQLPAMSSTSDLNFLEAYVTWAQGVRPAQVRWSRPDEAEIEAAVGPDEAVLLKVNFDRGWRSAAGPVHSDPIGFLLIEPNPGAQPLHVSFGAPWDMWLGRAITLLTIGLLVSGARPYVIGAFAIAPAMAAYFYLMASLPPQVAIAERSFQMTRPPIINPAGIVDVTPRDGRSPDGRRPITIYGFDLGNPGDNVSVWIGGQQGRVLGRVANQINVEVPAGTQPRAEVRVEVNGCRGNAFLLDR